MHNDVLLESGVSGNCSKAPVLHNKSDNKTDSFLFVLFPNTSVPGCVGVAPCALRGDRDDANS